MSTETFPSAFAHGCSILFHQVDNLLDPSCQFILLSDMHAVALEIAQKLESMDLLKDSIVIAAGDMAGTGKIGSDGDPYEAYKYFLDHSKAFYFVQGNHDYYSDEVEGLRNKDDTFCSLDRYVVTLGEAGLRVGRVHGIIGKDKPELHKFPRGVYQTYLRQVLGKGLDVLVTHETPSTFDCPPQSQNTRFL